MSEYKAPIKDMLFVLKELAGLDKVAALPGCEDVSEDLVQQILEENGKFSSEVLAPLNQSGDQEGSVLKDGAVTTPKGFRDAYRQFVDGGWNSLPFDPEFGGQGMPWLLATTVQEMWQAANMGFGLVLLLNQGAIDAIHHHGSAEQKQRKARYQAKDIPQLFPAGSDIVIQVVKDQIGTKGPRSTTNIALPGRYVVYMPTLEHMGVSRKQRGGHLDDGDFRLGIRKRGQREQRACGGRDFFQRDETHRRLDAAAAGSGVRPDQTNMEQYFHNDNSYNTTPPEYVGLLCERPARSGGISHE